MRAIDTTIQETSKQASNIASTRRFSSHCMIMTFIPDFFEKLNHEDNDNYTYTIVPAVPEMALLRSQETVATIGSMTGEFLDLMKSVESVPQEMVLTGDDPLCEFLADITFSSKDFQAESSGSCSAGKPQLQDRSVAHESNVDHDDKDDKDWLSDDSSTVSTPVQSRARSARRKPTPHKANVTTAKKRVRKVYNIPPHKRKHVPYNDSDVLCQRGGLANKHPGNHRYLAAKDALQDIYLATPKAARTGVAQQLVDQVHAWGGRFLRKDNRGWYEIHNHTARTKAGQALREDYTPEERKEKRIRYKAQLKGN